MKSLRPDTSNISIPSKQTIDRDLALGLGEGTKDRKSLRWNCV